jgi:hypothetical protein
MHVWKQNKETIKIVLRERGNKSNTRNEFEQSAVYACGKYHKETSLNN